LSQSTTEKTQEAMENARQKLHKAEVELKELLSKSQEHLNTELENARKYYEKATEENRHLAKEKLEIAKRDYDAKAQRLAEINRLAELEVKKGLFERAKDYVLGTKKQEL